MNSRCSAIILAFLLNSCGNFSWLPKEESAIATATEKKGGKVINGIDKKYYPNGKLYAEIEMKSGKRHGLSKSYYRSGNLHLEMPYVNGEKEGDAKMYWESGRVKRVTPYSKGKINGVRKSYFTNGKLSSALTYQTGNPHNDLKEYTQEGNETSNYPQLKYSIDDRLDSDGSYKVTFSFENGGKKSEFYVGKLINGKIFDEDQLEPLNGHELIINLEKNNYLVEAVPIVGKCLTKKSNPFIHTIILDLAIKRE